MNQEADSQIVRQEIPVKYPEEWVVKFWAKTTKLENGCIVWAGGTDCNDGYGVAILNRKNIRTHIVSWEIANGIKASPLQVQHLCNTRLCVNPEHLVRGTHQQNMEWMKKSGRAATGDRNGARIYPERVMRGEKCHASKLNPDKVREIRRLREDGLTLKELSDIFGVRECVVSEIARKVAWKHVM